MMDYTGTYVNDAWNKDTLTHYHYRFDSPNDEEWGLFSFNFLTNSQGEIDAMKISLDEGQVVFSKMADENLKNPEILAKYTGKYDIAGAILKVELIDKKLCIIIPGQPTYNLDPVKPNTFSITEFPDIRIEFVIENGTVAGLKQIDPSGQYYFKRVL